MGNEINPISCSRKDLIYYLLTYEWRCGKVPQHIRDRQLEYAAQLLARDILDNL